VIELVFRNDAYTRECSSRVLGLTADGGIILERTVFYAAAGGQHGDTGHLVLPGGEICKIATTVYGPDKSTPVHVPVQGDSPPKVGDIVTAVLDWDNRHRLMRMHTGLHLLCSLVKFPVTGGQVGAQEGRLDFDIEDASAIDKDALTQALNALVAADHPVTERFITDAQLEANPGLVRTMSVKPPMGTGQVRLVAIGADGSVDLQPCGGTHVKHTGEIGTLAVTKIEKKGKINRRIRVAFV
jgi:misacylated tRNA(Ala) deacylase